MGEKAPSWARWGLGLISVVASFKLLDNMWEKLGAAVTVDTLLYGVVALACGGIVWRLVSAERKAQHGVDLAHARELGVAEGYARAQQEAASLAPSECLDVLGGLRIEHAFDGEGLEALSAAVSHALYGKKDKAFRSVIGQMRRLKMSLTPYPAQRERLNALLETLWNRTFVMTALKGFPCA